MVSAPLFFLRVLFSFIFNKEAKLVFEDLFSKFSYRYGKEAASSFKTPFVYLKAGFRLIYLSGAFQKTNKQEICLYDNASDFETGDRAYLNALGIKEANFLFKDHLPNLLGPIERAVNLLALGIVAIIVLPVSLFSRDKAKPGLIALELAEITLLLSNLRENGAKKLLVLSSYEKEISFTSWYVKKKLNVKVYLFPSPNPIKHLYKNVICDTFIFSAPFQQKEYEKLKNNWRVEKTEYWPPYGFQEIEINGITSPAKNTVGLVSSGMELRKNLQHSEPYGNLDYHAETEMIGCLKEFLGKHPEVSLIVYLHPREKQEANIDFSKNYYRKLFGPQVRFAPLDKSTKSCLSLSDVAVAGFSSAQFERLFGGYKTLFAPLGFLTNYFSDETIESVCINSPLEFDKRLSETLEMTTNDFFSKKGLGDYRWDFYNKQPFVRP